jgi:Zn-dependent oligopeptidase
MQNPLYNTEVQPYGQDDIHYLQRFSDQLQGVMRGVMGSYGEAPSDVLVEAAAQMRKELDQHLQEFNSFINTEVAAFNKTAAEHGSSTLFAGGPIQIKSEGSPTPAGSGGDNDDDDNN